VALQTNGVLLDLLTVDPSSPVEGQVWYNTTLKQLRVYRDGLVRTIESRKTNVTSAAPAASNDSTQGYEVGSRWIDTSGVGAEYVAISVAAGAAIWLSTTPGGEGSGISSAQHQALRQLIHFIDDGPANGFASGAYRVTTGTVFPSAITWWESAALLKKIVEKLITYVGAFPSSIQWKMYDTDGTTVIATVTDAITYSGPFETSRTRTIA
jgi:hypothetical protein